ncbi:MAG: NADH:flavin oxidoreductase [Steroidobacteraceae bacterium]|jgi:2,4-dienoyl-CoA reductase-like NADH-dependent reductase (Old Yellow Enzyme family)|nr:NADH:flavin oxidoreductase [Steroidobacteraceae bacterium]
MSLFDPLSFSRGPVLRNRFALAPLTNLQSHDDGRLSEDEFRWLTLRAKGGFGLVSTCAAHVQAQGLGFRGQLGIFADVHLEGLTRLAAAIKAAGSVAVVQLHHAGRRSPPDLVGGRPVAPSEDAETGARALSLGEVEQLAEDFIAAALRAERAGFDGVELHGAHGYVICQFLSPQFNRRDDRYGGTPDNRARLLLDVIAGVRARCRPDFLVGVRLSPERFGLALDEMQALAGRLMREAQIDFLDLSLWDVNKEPEEEAHRGRKLLACFTGLDRGEVRLGAAGRIDSGPAAARALAEGLDFVIVGRAAILHHDFPQRVRADPSFMPVPTPVSAGYLRDEGLGEAFIDYMRTWEGFVSA